ncbi:hypothetical protein [Nocardia arthritidis]|uniref:Uncharacterized protein n=1 Tax=Nocardia arthritidis TaxID=228602 RepID=A0A6G9YN44_9NOCA|nr:hypothetical protein [Nocardia arthritidis]QIS14622.1 hypothetical protein F5544_33935 [Nocardia arthritidis]
MADVPMSELSVTSAALLGFAGDLRNTGESLLRNTSRISSMLSLPGDASGLLETLTSSFQNFRDRVSALGRQSHDQVLTFGSNLETTVQRFQQQDTAWARAMTTATSSLSLPPLDQTATDKIRFSGMQFFDPVDIQTENLSVKAVVTGAHDIISIFDERLSQSIGIKPAEYYLSPLACDWEHIRTIGKRIRQLGTNDSVTAWNLNSGSRWLSSKWSGKAADSYATTISTLETTISQRSADMETISNTLEKGGECLERLVYNQAAGVSTGLMEPLKLLGFSLPVGVWAQVADRPMNDAVKNQITSAINTVRTMADTRNTEIKHLLERIQQVLAYEPGTRVPEPTDDLFNLPSKIVADLGTLRYGYKNNVWWEHSLASTL